MAELIRPLYDTPTGQQVSVSLDVGIIPQDYPHAGRYIVTIQAWPLPTMREAQMIAAALREAINARLGIKMELQDGQVVDARVQ
jgi:hypothetical protein